MSDSHTPEKKNNIYLLKLGLKHISKLRWKSYLLIKNCIIIDYHYMTLFAFDRNVIAFLDNVACYYTRNNTNNNYCNLKCV